jgi:hypothetical protein
MPAPIFNTALVAAALAPLVPDLVLEVVDLSGRVTADLARRLQARPGLIIASEGCTVSGDGGMGSGRWITERLALTIQLADVAPLEAPERPGLREIRTAIWEALEALRPDPDWSELRYDGGSRVALDDGTWTWIESYITSTGTTTAPRLPAP